MAERSFHRAVDGDRSSYLEIAAVLDVDPDRRPDGNSDDLYEAASVDGATKLQKFKYVTWPSLRTLYITSTILSMIWTLGDFNSVYLLTGGGPADLTHVLATLGIRYRGSIRLTCRWRPSWSRCLSCFRSCSS